MLRNFFTNNKILEKKPDDDWEDLSNAKISDSIYVVSPWANTDIKPDLYRRKLFSNEIDTEPVQESYLSDILSFVILYVEFPTVCTIIVGLRCVDYIAGHDTMHDAMLKNAEP